MKCRGWYWWYQWCCWGWWRWAMVSPDGVAPSRMDGVSASVNLPLHHKVQKFCSGTGSAGRSRKKGRKAVVVVVVTMSLVLKLTCGRLQPVVRRSPVHHHSRWVQHIYTEPARLPRNWHTQPNSDVVTVHLHRWPRLVLFTATAVNDTKTNVNICYYLLFNSIQ